MKKLAIISTHPIQYNAPLFALLQQRAALQVKVFYTWGESVLKNKYDPGFGKVIDWDVPLLEGYAYTFLKNTSPQPGSHHFKGVVNPGLIQAVESYQPNAILIYGWSFQSHLQAMRYFKGKVPVLFRGDSTLLDKTSFFQQVKRLLFLRWVYRYVDQAIYTGTSNKQYFKKAGLRDGQLVFGPHVVDNARFAGKETAGTQMPSTFREQWGVPPTAILILFAGKFEHKKNPLLLIDAFNEVEKQASLHLVMVGNGPLEASMKAAAASSNRIHFMDFQNQTAMPDLYAAADLFVLPSQGPGETWGLAVNEAMAAGKAVIVSDKCGCAADLVKEGKNGFVFESGNKKQLTACIEKMIDTKETLQKMGKESLAVIANYTLEALATAIENTVLETKSRKA